MIATKTKIAVLKENYRQGNARKCGISFADWVFTESENDPAFFRWLFENPELGDFECPDKAEFECFMLNVDIADATMAQN